MGYQNILLIDDDKDDQEIFIAALKEVEDSIVCITSNDAHDALQKLANNIISPDVIFLDLNMPKMTGQQFLTEIKKKPKIKEIPIIIFSTSSNSKTIRETLDLGAMEFITKPGKYEELIQKLSPLIDSSGR